MADPHSAPSADRFEVRVTADSHFSWIRTRLSLERTMMSWIPTAVALIGFGFAIVQFFECLEQMPGVRPADYPNAPRDLGLALISYGVLAFVISVWQYLWGVRYLWGGTFAPIARVTREGMQSPFSRSPSLLIGIGVFAFFAVLLRLV
jgi:putative membrane protein